VKLRVVFDSTTVVSALCFPGGRLRWLIRHWRGNHCTPLVSRDTAAEATRVLAYPKFKLSPHERFEFLADYIPFCEVVAVRKHCATACRDPRDQPFLDLAHSGNADVLVSGDSDLLVLAGETGFAIESPEAYRQRVAPTD
jgi:putative PIN family toxin of toxin-antitoxin system